MCGVLVKSYYYINKDKLPVIMFVEDDSAFIYS